MRKNQKRNSTMSLLIILSFAVSLIALPATNTVQAIDWFPYVTASPNPVGVGQNVLMIYGFTFPTRGYGFKTFDGWTITITDPNGKVQTLGPYNADSTGSGFASFVPDKIGTWKIKAHYPGGYVDFGRSAPYQMNVSVPAADTNEVTLTVQEAQIQPPSGVPVPTNYWQMPIYGENSEWYQIAGNWLMPAYDTGRQFDWGAVSGAFNPYTKAPNTGHIMWTMSNLFGGIVGGETPMSYYTGSSYRRELQPPVVINGRLYYNVMEPPQQGYYCVDLYTGQQIWYVNATYPDGKGGLVQGAAARIQMGQVLTYDTRNWHGGIAYLWSTGATTWAVWDAWSGNLLYTIVNAPAITTDTYRLTFFEDPTTGTIFNYQWNDATGTLVKWNSTKMFDTLVSSTMANWYNSGPKYNLDWNAGIEWNKTIPALAMPGGRTQPAFDPKDMSIIIFNNQSSGNIYDAGAFKEVAISTDDGRVLWTQVRNEGTWEIVIGGRAMSIEDGVYAIYRKETRQIYGYDINTGNKLWASDPRPNQWAMYWTGGCIAYGKLFSISYDGTLIAQNVKTGKIEWIWGPVDSGIETPYGVYPLYGGMTIADGKVLVANGEHSANSPLYRGEQMYAIDAENGTTVWSMPGWYQQNIAANGLVLTPNAYDGKIYCFGKGPSAVTVSTPDTALTLGQSIVIKGTVTDISAGASQDAVAKNFPNGLPTVSDESQSQWMSYVYQQKPMPNNATGVPVSIDVIDANNNFRHIGTATSDITGAYSFMWTPDIPGKYTLIASFAGSESYWPSSSETSFGVEIATTTAPTSTVQAVSSDATQMYIIGIGVAIIIAIAIVGALIMMTLRKRP